MQQVNSGVPASGPIIAAAIEVVVASEANPTPELSLIGTSVPNWAMTVTATAGTDEATLYRLDATAAAANPPYIVTSATAGLKWVAIAGRYVAQDITSLAVVTGISGVVAGGTLPGPPVFNNVRLEVNGTTGYVTAATASAVMQLNLRASQVGITNGTAAATSPITGWLVIGDGVTAATNIGMGGGVIYAGRAVTGTWAVATAYAFFQNNLLPVVAGNYALIQSDDGTVTCVNAKTGGVGSLRINNVAVVDWISTKFSVVLNTLATSTTTGAFIVGDSTNPGTNVGIGGGKIFADGTTLGTGTGAKITIESGGPTFTRLVNTTGSMVFYTAGGSTNMLALSAGGAVVPITTAATSSLTGSLVIGDTATAGTNVGIGGGIIYVGDSLRVSRTDSGGLGAILRTTTGESPYLMFYSGGGYRHTISEVDGAAGYLKFTSLDGTAYKFDRSIGADLSYFGEVTGANPKQIFIGYNPGPAAYDVQALQQGVGFATLSLQRSGGSLSIRNVPYVWPAANAVGALANDGAGNLSWGGAGVAIQAFWAAISNATLLGASAAGALLTNRMYYVTGAANFDLTLPVAPANNSVVGVVVAERAFASAIYRLDAGAGVQICGRTRFLSLVHTNVVLLMYDGARWVPLVLDLDSPWVSAGAISLSASNTAPTKGTVVRDTFYWARQGKNIVVSYFYSQSAAGSAGNGQYWWNLPFGAFDTTVLVAGVNNTNLTRASIIGNGQCTDTLAATDGYVTSVHALSSTQFGLCSQFSAASAFQRAVGSATFPLSSNGTTYSANFIAAMTDW